MSPSTYRCADGTEIPVFGQGTWRMGEDPAHRSREVAALRLGLDLGLTLIDTAEMYADGEAERVVGEAIRRRRDEVFLVSKVLPQNASRAGTLKAAEASLRRLETDHLDLYLLHWEGPHPLGETVEAFQALVHAGKIRSWGVSNLDCERIEELSRIPGGEQCAVNQILYNLSRRSPEGALLDLCRGRRMGIMAYSPLEQERLLDHPVLRSLAAARGRTPAQLALAWLLEREGVIVIPKATRPEHLRENAAARELRLTAVERARLDETFPPPTGPAPLEFL